MAAPDATAELFGLDRVLEEMKTVLRQIPEVARLLDEPGGTVPSGAFMWIYPGTGRYRLGTSAGARGTPKIWQLETVIIDILKNTTDLPGDMRQMRPFADAIPTAIFRAFAEDRIGGKAALLGSPDSASTDPVRRDLIAPVKGGMDFVGYRFEVDVSFQVEILYDR